MFTIVALPFGIEQKNSGLLKLEEGGSSFVVTGLLSATHCAHLVSLSGIHITSLP